MLPKAKQAALTPSCSSSRSEGVVAFSKGSNIPWAEDNYDINYYCCLHNEHLPTIYLCHCIPNSPIYSWKSSYLTLPPVISYWCSLSVGQQQWVWDLNTSTATSVGLCFMMVLPWFAEQCKAHVVSEQQHKKKPKTFHCLFLPTASFSALQLSKLPCLSCIFRDLECSLTLHIKLRENYLSVISNPYRSLPSQVFFQFH